MKSSQVLSNIASVIGRHDNFVITVHERPDGDAVGSMLAMAHALKAQGKSILAYAKDEVPGYLGFLPGVGMITQELSIGFDSGFCLILLDCHDMERPGPLGPRLFDEASEIIVLDHHLGAGPCDKLDKPCFSLIDTTACATAEICLELFELAGWQLTGDIATCLYTAIVTDTGGFRYSNTNAHTFDMAGKLVRCGANPYEIALNCFESSSLAKLKLLGLALETLETYYGGLMAVMNITPEMFELTGASEFEIGDLVSYARAIDTVELAALVKEVKAGEISVSLRSKKYVNVAEIAGKFGGGGHFNAAGFRVKGNRAEVKEKLIALAGDHLHAGRG